MKKILFLLTGFTLFFTSCEKDSNMSESENSINGKTQRNYRITVDEAINNVNSLLDIIDNNNSGNGNVTMSTTTHRRIIKDVSVMSKQDFNLINNSNTALTLMSAANSSNTSEIDTLVYVINFENDEGFALASADSRYESVFCITENGNYSPDDSIDNPGFANFMEGINLYLMYIPSSCPECLSVIGDIYGDWETVTQVEKLKVRWGQGYPYNNNTPTSSGIHAPAGCVATAIAQIFSYYQYPASHSSYSYNWTNMLQHEAYPSYTSYSAAYSDLAYLFRNDIGLGVNMDYDVYESRATINDAYNYLNNRGYNTYNGIINYNTEQILSALTQNKLIFTAGYKSLNQNGHAWVIDGYIHQQREVIPEAPPGMIADPYYEYRTLVHCNWG
ncbi:MAG: C10 family peptidase, partial [Prevotellaceae bacterium]|nr:C10 family peptidase [Prevotellaceae bacterium]